MTDFGAKKAEVLYQIGKAVGNVVIRPKYLAEGNDKIPESDCFIFCAYHDSGKNIGEDANLTNRQLRFVAKEELFRIPAFGQLLRATRQIRATRLGVPNFKEIYRGLEQAIADNAGIVLYLEGTRNKSDTIGRAGKFMQGVAGFIVGLSEKYETTIRFVSVGRKTSLIDGQETRIVSCEESAYVDKGKVVFSDPQTQDIFNSIKSEKEGLEFLVNGHLMPTIARLSEKTYDPQRSSFQEAYGSSA